MNRKGDCWDHAPAESFFATLKVEELRNFELNTRDEARNTERRYVCSYNAHWRNSPLGLLSLLPSKLNPEQPPALPEPPRATCPALVARVQVNH
jgi:hypothetical protein